MNIVLYDLLPATTYEFRVKTIKGNEATVYGISVYNTTFDDGKSGFYIDEVGWGLFELIHAKGTEHIHIRGQYTIYYRHTDM